MDIRVVLGQLGIKRTKPRIRIMEVLLKNTKPISLEDICRRAGKHFDFATVYRTLTLFQKKQLVRRVDVGQNRSFFELLRSADDHHHIICTDCGTVEDFKRCIATNLQPNILKSSIRFRTITYHAFEFFGLCKKCEKSL